MNCFIYYVCKKNMIHTYYGLHTHIFYYITILNTILPWFLCFFLSKTTTIFRFLELPNVKMCLPVLRYFLEGICYFKNFIQDTVCVYIRRSQDLLNRTVTDGISNHCLLHITYTISYIFLTNFTKWLYS